ncbi:MAG: hypothetical protein Q8J78_06490 [Moraxellaceae bacterium]|nr:hypothetical protein [Moraxellaceae bacterium]
MSTATTPVKQEALPFQKENLATNQPSVPLPYLAGTRLIAVRWITPALGQITQPVKGAGKKS